MALISISKALEILKVSKATLYRDMKLGKVSFSLNNKGNKVIDVTELIRVYGNDKVLINETFNKTSIPNRTNNETFNKNIDNNDNIGDNKELEFLRKVLIEKDLRIEDLKKTIGMLDNQLNKTNLMLEDLRRNNSYINANVRQNLESEIKKEEKPEKIKKPKKKWWKLW